MRVVIAAIGEGLDGAVSPTFARASFFTIVDAEKAIARETRSIRNPFADDMTGVEDRAVRWVIESGAKAVVAGSFAPAEAQALLDAGVRMHHHPKGTILEAVDTLKKKRPSLKRTK